MTGSLAWLVTAAVVFLLIHTVPSSPLRPALVGAIGAGPYRGLFALISAAGLGWLIWAYLDAPRDGPVYWDPGVLGRYLAVALMAVAWIVLVASFTTPNPAMRDVSAGPPAERGARGIVRVTRHPLFWGIALWGIAHLINNADGAAIILFASLTLLALVGGALIDRRKRQALGGDWPRFVADTSNLPFAAILAGRNKLVAGEIGWWRVALGLVLFAVVGYFHGQLFGVSLVP